MLKIALLGIVAVLLIIFLKGTRPEYGMFISIFAGLLIIAFVIGKMSYIIDVINKYLDMIAIDKEYFVLLIKIIGITYIAEFSSQICKDSGCSSIAGQIETAAKIIIISMSLPVLCSVIDMLNNCL